MSGVPYQRGKTPADFYAKKAAVRGRVVAVLKGRVKERGLSLLPSPTRALLKNEIHELLITGEEKRGSIIHQVAYLAFIVIEEGGVIIAGEKVIWQDKELGTVLGFDGTHLPNHYNIILCSPHPLSGEEQGIALGDAVLFAGM